jgi:hypothetical protein
VSNTQQTAPQPLTAADICARFTLKKDARALLREGMTPGKFLSVLMANKQYVTAIEFMAHAMPPRSAIWWGCLCLQHIFGATLSPPDWTALQAATVWVLWPTEQYRGAAYAPGRAAGPASPAGLLAMAASAVGVSGRVPMTPAKAVAKAITLASVKAEPVKIADTQRVLVDLGAGVVQGRFPWPTE